MDLFLVVTVAAAVLLVAGLATFLLARARRLRHRSIV